jgi:hypothetical protein
MPGNDAFESFLINGAVVLSGETSLFIHAAAIDPKMIRDSSLRSE